MSLEKIRNFCIISHIDHGKSTLADRLLEFTNTIEKRKMKEQILDMHPLERERGITIKLQPVRMQYKDYSFNLIDTPGHADFSYEVSRSLAAVEGALLLVDATKGVQAQTLSTLYAALEQDLDIIPVINKIDLPNAQLEEVEAQVMDLLGVPREEIIHISAKEGTNVDTLLKAIVVRISAPVSRDDKLQALIFDSFYDSFKGVVVYVRIFGGKASPNDKVVFCASSEQGEIKEVGHFSPQLVSTSELSSGEIGYIATGLKDMAKARVGDTIAADNSVESLEGYKEPKPVVFASFFPRNADDYEELKDSLEKIKLFDASLIYEPQSSEGLGRGFKCGFLGMLHVEIVSERLRRDFNLDLIVSTPSVEYTVNKGDGSVELIRSASALPDPNYIETIEEPVVAIEIISPQEYLGPLMDLMKDKRGIFVDRRHMGGDTVILRYTMPLADMIEDFYDRLKSISSGYASFSYEPKGTMASDLVRLDILVAGDMVEPFSRIVPRERAYTEGKRVLVKLKETLPAQQFTVALQAAIGSKIIAREDIRARRKDVTGYLYGGDVTRKMKLLKKQARGKKRLKETGKVHIPQNVFLEVLKR